MKKWIVIALYALCALAAIGSTRRAFAAPPVSDAKDVQTERMRRHFSNGVKLYDAKPPDYEGALAEFRAAYGDKPLPSIKQNIALCLKALHKYAEAVDSLEEMLAEGNDTLKPGVREATSREITEMNAFIATVRVTIDAHVPPGMAAPRVVLVVDDAIVPTAKAALPMRFGPGEHAFRAHADGFADAQRRVTVVAGQRDVVVVLELVPVLTVARGGLRVRANVAAADVSVDGDAPRKSEWSGEIGAGAHRVTASAPGYKSVALDVTVVAGETRDFLLALEALPMPPLPPPVDGPPPSFPPPSVKKTYGMLGLSLQEQSMRLAPRLDEPAGGTRRAFSGAAFVLRAGRKLGKNADFGGIFELGILNVEDYPSPNFHQVPAKMNLYNWVLAPELRLHTRGQLRFVTSFALGLEGQILSATLAEVNTSGAGAAATTTDRKASGAGIMAMIEAGVQVEFKKVYVEGAGFLDAHAVEGLKDNGDRLFYDSPVARVGLRLLVGFDF